MAVKIPLHEDVQEGNDVPVLDKVAVQSPSLAIFAEDVGEIMKKQDSSKSQIPELLLELPSQVPEDDGMAVLDTMAVHSSSPFSAEDVLVVLQPEDSSQSKSLGLLSQASGLSRVASPANFLEDTVSFLETSGCPEDDGLLSMNDRKEGMSKEPELNGPKGLWTEESALLLNRSEGCLTEESELHPEILEILHLLFSYSSGKPFRSTLSGLDNTVARICKCDYHVWFEKVATFNAGDELLVIVHWSNMYLFEGGLCLIHGKGLAFRNKKITWQIQKCFLFGKQTTQEIHNLILKEGKRIVSAALSETNRGNTVRESDDEQVYTEYSVISITGDGRCLFRAVAHGLYLRCGKVPPDESQQLQLADDLRQKVADELVKRRCETEWFIEGDFDDYVNLIRQPYVWGGEPEVLMLTYVLEVPITVYLEDQNTKDGIIAICKYGQEYGTDNPIRVLYDGHAHYEALQLN